MMNKYIRKGIVSLFILSAICLPSGLHAMDATISLADVSGNKVWTLENNVLAGKVEFTATGQIRLTSFYNKAAGKEYLTGGGYSTLFQYKGKYVTVGNTQTPTASSVLFDLNAYATGWQYVTYTTEDILMYAAVDSVIKLGEKLSITVTKGDAQVKMVFELYNGNAGIRYQCFIKNLKRDAKMIIEQADVIKLNFPKTTHNLHYVTNRQWLSTNSTLEESLMNNKGQNVPKCFVNLYNTNDGWYIAPEVNWKTLYGPEIEGSTESPTTQGYEYMHRSYASLCAWPSNGTNVVRISTCPESFQLVLFPEEEFEFIAVNLTVFKGDIVDGKMAAEEHLRKRFKFHHTSTLLNTNDWDWFTNGNRNENFYRTVVIPQAKKAGVDMIMFDDGWNNAKDGGTSLDNTGTSRDPVIPFAGITTDMEGFTDYIISEGFRFGLWYSMSGGNHNKGFDLASPEVVEAKREKIEYLINHYNMSHQMIDLTEYWQKMDNTSYSHPSDNVYRKAVRTRNLLNDLVDKYPQYMPKLTSEVDIHPTQGDRSTELIHLGNNGWITSISLGNGNLDIPSFSFGHLPLNSVYYGTLFTGKMQDYYAMMFARNIKLPEQPDKWPEAAVTQMSAFNKWRKGCRVRALTEEITRPVFLGEQWNDPVAANWKFGTGPYLWMYTNKEKSQALLVATTGGNTSVQGKKYSLRWLDATKTYLVEDISLDDTGVFTSHFIGKYTGSTLINDGLEVNLYQNSSAGKAFWIQEFQDKEREVLYADENIYSYTENVVENKLTVTAKGLANASGKIIVYGKTENDAMQVTIHLDGNGDGTAEITTIANNDAPYPGFKGSLRFELENLHASVVKSNPGIAVTSSYNGSPDSESGYSSVMGMTALNDFVLYPIEIPAAGTYTVSVKYKISKNSRGVAQWYLNDGTNDTAMGPVLDQSTDVKEEMKTLNFGDISFDTAGVKMFKMKLVGLGVSGSGLVISGDYIVLSRKNP